MTPATLKSCQEQALKARSDFARAAHPRVCHWVRNWTTAPCGFGLPTSRGRFFADFVAELTDGRIAVLA